MKPVSRSLARAITALRDSYRYPAYNISKLSNRSARDANAIDLGRNGHRFGLKPLAILGRFNEDDRATDLKLDKYHCDLLHSLNYPDAFIGVASTIYWGFAKARFARNRVDWMIDGRGGGAPQHPRELVIRGTRLSLRDLKNGLPGKALSRLAGINEVRRMPFASKVITFMAPEIAGVYDSKINAFLKILDMPGLPALSAWQMSASVERAEIQAAYERWCRYLQEFARDLNSAGTAYAWRCTETEDQRWRAVDIERALFRLAMDNQSGLRGPRPRRGGRSSGTEWSSIDLIGEIRKRGV